MASEFGAPQEIIQSIFNFHPDALEEVAQWIEQRGLRIPVGQVVGYRPDQLFVLVQRAAGSQSINSGSDTTVTFDTTTSDEQKTFDGTSSITLPYAGVYIVTAYAQFAANATGKRENFLLTSAGGGTVFSIDTRMAVTTAAEQTHSTVTGTVKAAKGDVISQLVRQESGGALNLELAALSVALISRF